MYAQQASIDPALAALMQTAQMVTPDQTPTVAAQVAQAAQQKMQPQGIAQGMPQARQDFQAAMPSMMRNMQQQQMQKMVQQAMQPKPAGIEGLPSNIRMAEGGVVGYAGPDGSFVGPSFAQNLSDAEIERMTPEQRKAYYKQMLSRRNAPTPVPPPTSSPGMSARPGLGIAGAIAKKLGPLGLLAGLFTTSDEEIALLNKAEAERNAVPDDGRPRGQENYEPTPQLIVGNAPPMAPEAQRMTDRQVPRGIVSAPPPPVQRPPAPATAAPTGLAALPAIKEPGGMDRDRIETAGSAFLTQAEKDIAAAQGIEARRKEAMKSMPDLNQRGIAALEAAEQERKRLLGIDRSDDSRRRWAGVFRGWGGDRDAYDRIVGGIANRDALANQAQLGFEQARIKEMQAQQARALGEFDRERALLKESADMKNKARDDMLRAQQITAQVESGELTSRTNVYDAQMRARDAELNREAQRKLEEYRRQTQLMKPKEQDMVSRLEALKLIELTGGKPETATPAQKVQALESAIRGSRGTGVEEKAEFANLSRQATILQNELKMYLDAADPRQAKSPRVAEIQRELNNIRLQLGGGAPTAAPTGNASDPLGIRK